MKDMIVRSNSLFLWDYSFFVDGNSIGAMKFNLLSENGSIAIDGKHHEVRKGGVFSGTWSVIHAGEVIETAHKPSMFARRMDLERERLTIRPRSAFGRTFIIEKNAREVGRIEPHHIFTSSHTIRLGVEIPLVESAFMSWLSVLSWRRSSRNAAASNPA